MVNNEFLTQAEEMLQSLLDDIESADADVVLDTELQDGVLKLETESGEQYVINIHRVMEQIWLSSPQSGAHHFSWDGSAWRDREGGELVSILTNELQRYLGRAFR